MRSDERSHRFWFAIAIAYATTCLVALATNQNAETRRQMQERWALDMAHRAAMATATSLAGDPGNIPLFVEQVLQSGVNQVRVLKGAKWFIHSDPAKVGTRLDRESIDDKEVFDRAQRLKARFEANEDALRNDPSLGRRRPFPETEVEARGDEIRASVPVVHRGSCVAMAEAAGRFAPPNTGSGSLSLLVIALVSIVLFWYFGAPTQPWRRAITAGTIMASLVVAGWATLAFVYRDWSEVPPVWFAHLRAICVAIFLFAVAVYLTGAHGGFRWLARTAKQNLFAYSYVAPAMLGMALLVFIPLLYGVGLGFFTKKYNQWEFAGLANFVQVLSDFRITQAGSFYFKLGVTVLWTVANVFLHVAIGLGLALLLKDATMKLRGVYRVLLIVPWAVPNYITALIWKGMFHKQFGAVNAALVAAGGEPVSWFNSFGTAFAANLATNTWLGFPFMMVICLGALQSIPQDLYEAADVDGATRWQKFRHITLPLLMPALFPAIVLGTIWTFNMFNIIYLVSGGAPDGATDILITDAFRWAFERDQYGYAAAYSTVIFLILLAFTLSTNRVTKATEGVYG